MVSKINDFKLKLIKRLKHKNVKLTDDEKKLLKEEKQKIKEAKKEAKKIVHSNLEIVPILDYREDGILITKDGFIEIYQIASKDIYALNDEEARIHMYYFTRFLRSYIDDIKLVCMNFPVNTYKQQKYIKKKINETDNELYKQFLNQKLLEFEFLENHRSNKEYFIMIFIKKEKDINEKISSIKRSQNIAMKFKEIDKEKKTQILFKLNNPNTKLID